MINPESTEETHEEKIIGKYLTLPIDESISDRDSFTLSE